MLGNILFFVLTSTVFSSLLWDIKDFYLNGGGYDFINDVTFSQSDIVKNFIQDFNPIGFGAYVPQKDMIHLIDKNYLKFLILKTKQSTKVTKKTLDVEAVRISNLNHAQFSIDAQQTIQNLHFIKSMTGIQRKFMSLGQKLLKSRSGTLQALGKLHEQFLKLAYENCAKKKDCQLKGG